MELYDTIGGGYDNTRCADPYILGRLLYHLGSNAHGDYLDVGCGTGNYTTGLFGLGMRMVGLDLSTTMLERAKHKGPEIRWNLASADAMAFASKSFAGAVATFVDHHFRHPHDPGAGSVRQRDHDGRNRDALVIQHGHGGLQGQ